MENTTALDSNSESDISDSWALIDEDSSLEWNNEMGLNTRKFIVEKSEVTRTSSRNELSDEESIEVVADDHTDCLTDNEAEGTKGEQWSTGMTENLNLPEIEARKAKPATVKDVTSSVENVLVQPKKFVEYRPTLALITLLMGIVGGIAVGYSLAFHLQTFEDPTSISNTRALLAKLQNENLFLQHQLRFVHSSLRLAVSNVPKFKDTLKYNVRKKPLENSFIGDYSGMCTITDFILQSHFGYGNVSGDVCLATDKPQQDSHVFMMNENTNYDVSSLVDAHLSRNVEILNTSKNISDLQPREELNTVQIDKASLGHCEGSSIPNVGLFNENLYNKNVPLHIQSFESKFMNTDVKRNESGSDPRPFTKARNTMENIYTMLSILGSDIQATFPSKLEILSILPEHMADLDLSVESFAPENYKKIAALKNQIQDTAQKIFNDIESSINMFIQNIANKLKKFESNTKKQICKLKRRLENSPGKDHIDWNKPIFQKCFDYQQNGNNDAMRRKVDDSLFESKEDFVVSTSATFDDKKPNHKHYRKKEQGAVYNYNHHSENTKKTVTLSEKFKSKGETKFSHDKKVKSSQKLPKMEKDITENKKINYDANIQEKEMHPKHKNGQVQTDKQMRKKKWEEDRGGFSNVKLENYDKKGFKYRQSKLGDKGTDFNDGNHEKYDKKRTFEDKENTYENRYHKKMQKDKKNVPMDGTNISGEWTLKMAHGRAEHRRRDHQSDWLFDRAESRKFSRGKDGKNTYWHEHQDNSGRNFNSDMCNKTETLKNQASKAWKDMKHHVKENVWRPIVDTAKTAKKVFNNFNYYCS